MNPLSSIAILATTLVLLTAPVAAAGVNPPANGPGAPVTTR
jgi:hypothetical protein